MAPTTVLEQKTTTTYSGRNFSLHGYPLPLLDMLKVLPGVYYLERRSLFSPSEIRNTKKAIKQAFQNQIDKKGFSLVEVLSPCPTHWKLSPVECLERIKNEVVKTYPLGRLK